MAKRKQIGMFFGKPLYEDEFSPHALEAFKWATSEVERQRTQHMNDLNLMFDLGKGGR